MKQHNYQIQLGEKHVEQVWIEQLIPNTLPQATDVIGWVWRQHEEWKDGHRLRFWQTVDAVVLGPDGATVLDDYKDKDKVVWGRSA